MRVRPVLGFALPVCFSLVLFSAIPHGSSVALGPQTPQSPPAGETLSNPPVLKNLSSTPGVAEFDLTAAPATLELAPGKPTEAFAFNGSVPGPTIELREGDRVTVHFHNKLTHPTTVHWHGLHIPAGADGSPLNAVMPGGNFDYVFQIPMGSAGTYWYHPHPDMMTTMQVVKGLYGALIIRGANDPLAGIPERLMVLSDNRFRPDGSVDFPDPKSLQGQYDAENGREGNVFLVNGHATPTVSIRRGEVQRWRIINAGAARVYRLAIPGRKLTIVGSDGGLIEKPREADDFLLANSERVELLVRGTGDPGNHTVLQTLPYDRYDPHTRPPDWNQPHDLLELKTSADPSVDSPSIPDKLREIPAIDAKNVAAHRVITFSQGLINGKAMDMRRIDVRAKLNTTEIWQVENVVGMDHPFHLHGFRFQVLDRDGVPEPYRAWKDSVNVTKHGIVRVIVRFEDFPGKWMFHCHILDHEDMGMMGILEVR